MIPKKMSCIFLLIKTESLSILFHSIYQKISVPYLNNFVMYLFFTVNEIQSFLQTFFFCLNLIDRFNGGWEVSVALFLRPSEGGGQRRRVLRGRGRVSLGRRGQSQRCPQAERAAAAATPCR